MAVVRRADLDDVTDFDDLADQVTRAWRDGRDYMGDGAPTSGFAAREAEVFEHGHGGGPDPERYRGITDPRDRSTPRRDTSGDDTGIYDGGAVYGDEEADVAASAWDD
jgi:hypothetical protein